MVLATLCVLQRAAAGLWALGLDVWGSAGVGMQLGAPFGWLQGVQRTLSLRGFFFSPICAVNKVSVKVKAATLSPSVTHTSFLTKFAATRILHVRLPVVIASI